MRTDVRSIADGATGTRATGVAPGMLTVLLARLAEAPEAAMGSAWEQALRPGLVIGRFELLSEIGRGGFGVVWEARDRELGRSVAFKAVRAASRESLLEDGLLAEAEAAARLNHPNIVTLHDLGRAEAGPYLVLELLHGGTLAQRLEEGALPAREAVGVSVEVARGLAHAHERGVVHRDLKPGNVFLTAEGRVKILDFGLAHVFGRETLPGGTPAYMSPEQAAGAPGDERSDVFSLGVMLVEAITGKRPTDGQVPELQGMPRGLRPLLERMLSKEPTARPANGAEVREALERIQRAMEPSWRLWGALLGVALALVSAAATWWFKPPPLPPGRLLTVMADVDNQAGEPDLDGVVDQLRIGLEQSDRLSVVARSRLVNLLQEQGGPAPERIGEAVARATARQIEAPLLLVTSVVPSHPGYEVAVRGIDLRGDSPLFTERARVGGKGSLPDALDGLARRVREAAGEPREAVARTPFRLAEALPANPEAMRQFEEFKRLRKEGRQALLVPALRKVVELDPGFPQAHAELYQRTGDRSHLEKALENMQRFPPLERARYEALWRYDLGGSQSEMLRSFDEVIARWPEDPTVYELAADNYLIVRGDLRAARPYLEKAVALAALPPFTAISYLVFLGRMDEALARARRWTEKTPKANPFAFLAGVHLERGETAEALAMMRRSLALEDVSSPPRPWDSGQVDFVPFLEGDAVEELAQAYTRRGGVPVWWLEAQGRYREALASLDAAARAHGPMAKEDMGLYNDVRAELLASWGRDPEAVKLEVERQLWSGDWVGVSFAASYLIRVGRLDQAQAILDGLPPADYHVSRRLAEALLDWKRGNRERGLRKLEAIYNWGGLFYQAQILAELGRDREAAERFRRYRRHFHFGGWGVSGIIRSLYFEAVARERLGEREEARRLVDKVVRLWRRADADAPYVREARALAARLASGPAPASGTAAQLEEKRPAPR